jgi:hypothetical protein
MPVYTFELRDGECPVMDTTGVWFADRERAIEHAQNVARELMWGRELQTRSWHLDVYEAGACVHQLLFASIDPTLDHLRPALRMNVERSCDTLRGFKEAVSAARATVLETRALVARSRGKPYLATVAGKPTIGTSRPIPVHNDERGGSGKEGK